MLAEMCQNQQLAGHIPLKLLRYIVGVINYGGKLTHQEDQSILNRQVKTFLNNQVFADTSKGASLYERAMSMLDETVAS